MRFISFSTQLILAILVSASTVAAFEVEERKFYPSDPTRSTLRIISTADLDVFDPFIIAYQNENPGIAVDYTVTGTSELMKAITEEGAVFDVAISSAMDLQTKLANDGFAQVYNSPLASDLPGWAIWRDQLFFISILKI